MSAHVSSFRLCRGLNCAAAMTSRGFERENDGGEEIANFPSNLYGPNDGS